MKIKTRSRELLNSQKSSGAPLANRVGDLGRKYGSYLSLSLVSVSVYTSMIIWVMRGCCFFLNQNFIRKNLKARTRSRQLLNGREPGGTPLSNRVGDLGRKG